MATVTTDDLLRSALDYAGRGWLVVPLHDMSIGHCSCQAGASCKSGGKHPRISAWQTKASKDEETINEWWERWPSANVGVVLGEASGVIDIECDTDQAEKTLSDLFGGEFPYCPTYQASRGKHRLFKWSSDFPKSDQAVVKVHGIEFRIGGGGRGAQSVMPPSVHYTGTIYTWRIRPDEADLTELPSRVMDSIWRGLGFERPGTEINGHAPKKWEDVYSKPVLRETIDARDDTMYSFACHHARMIASTYGQEALDDPEQQGILFQTIAAFAKTKCAPPMTDEDCHRWLNSAIRFIKTKSDESEKQAPKYTALGLEFQDGEWGPGKWRVISVKSEPPKVKLFAPFLKNGYIELSMEEFDSPKAIHLKVLENTGQICLDDRPGVWARMWNGNPGTQKKGPTRGIKAKILDSAEFEEASPEDIRSIVIGDALYECLRRGRKYEEGKPPDMTGYPSYMEDGSIVFRFTRVYETLSMNVDKIRRDELSRLVKALGVKDTFANEGGIRRRLKMLSSTAIERLRNSERIIESF